jgi:flagellin
MKHNPDFQMDGINEDIFILSNGHISPVFYSCLARSGYFPVSELATFRKLNSRLQGHPTTHEHLPGVRIASGSLGQGLSVAIGAALVTDDTASDTTAAGSTRSSSAIAIAAAINRSSAKTGVTASAQPNIVRGTGFTARTTATTMYLNKVTITVNSSSRDGVIDSINDQASKTGVVASAWGDGIQLTAADGRNISIASNVVTSASLGLAGVTVAATAAVAVVYTSQVQLSSSNSFSVRAGSNGVPNLTALGFREGTFGGSDNGLKVNQLDVSTVSGATQAITAIDAAINSVSAAQAKSGAINNSLDVAISNLTEGSKNMQASRSRILDTDYAQETTNLAKQQIIQQAATAMLAQANQSAQGILSLLK